MVVRRRGHYGVSTVGFLRTGIAAYRGPSALVKELVQNADDARASRLEFRFQPDALIVLNDGTFSDQDFDSIQEIASGGKRDDADATGTWGTGFTSVYQITDRPEIRSSGRFLALEPLNNGCEEGPDERKVSGTEFRFPWRLQESELSQAIEVEPWKSTAIEGLHGVLLAETFQNILFLRHIDEIVVQDARQRVPVVTLRVQRGRAASSGRQPDTERHDFIVNAAGHPEWQGRWIAVSRAAAHHPTRWQGDTAIRLKRSLVQLAFGEPPPGASSEGLVYNTLPTPVRSGFRFQINADFYPTADRSAIVMTDDDKGRWNKTLVKTLAQLTADHLETIRDNSVNPEQFYDLLPLSCAAGVDYLQPIVDQVKETARKGQFVWTRGGWCVPRIARTPQNEQVIRIVEPEGVKLPEITPARLRADLQAYLGVRDYGLHDIALRLKERLRAGTQLESAPPMIANRERLDFLLRGFERDLASAQAASASVAPDVLRGLPLALDDEGRLQHMSGGRTGARLTPSQLRPLVPPGSFVLIDEEAQRAHERFYLRFSPPLLVTEVIVALKHRASDLAERPIAEAPPYLSAPGRLQQIWREMARAALDAGLTTELLSGAPILLDQAGILRLVDASATKPMFIADDETARLISSEDVSFLHPTLEEFESVWRLAGVQRVTPATAAHLLAQWCGDPRRLEDAPASIDSAAKLASWYRYLGNHAERISVAQRAELRMAAVVLTSQGVLADAGKDGELLSLPWTETPHPEFVELTRNVPYLVAVEVIDASTRPFLQKVLGIAPLSTDRYLIHHVLPYVAQATAAQHIRLLRAMRDEVLGMRGGVQQDVIRAMRDTELIPDQRGVLRRPGDIYHPDADLSDVFAGAWRRPAAELFQAKDDPEERRLWGEFLTLLDLPRRPLPGDLVQEARALARSQAHDPRRRHQALSILSRLNTDWQEGYQRHRDVLAPLREIRWLPALNRDGWFQPSELLPTTVADLVLSQAAVLDGRGRQIGGELSALLGMPTSAPYPAVIAHLVHLGSVGDTREPRAIYNFLDQSHILGEASSLLRELLDKPVIFNSRNQVWYSPRHTYLADVSADFGARRLSLPDQQHYLGLFKAMGVRTAIAPLEDALDLLLEVDREVETAGDQVTEMVIMAAQRVHRLLLRARQVAPDHEVFQAWCAGLHNVRCIPGTDWRLHRPGDIFINDLAAVDDWFPGEHIPLALVSDDQGSAHELLLQDIGVKRLSQAVQRTIVDATGPERDREWTLIFATLEAPLRRVCEARNHEEVVDWRTIEVVRVSRLSVQNHLDGERCHVMSEAIPVEAAFDREGNHLLVKQAVRNSRNLWPIVREVAQIIEPRRPSDVTTTLHAVLELAISGNGNQIERYLDNAQYPRSWRTGLTLDVNEEERDLATGQIGALAQDPACDDIGGATDDFSDVDSIETVWRGAAPEPIGQISAGMANEGIAGEAQATPPSDTQEERGVTTPRGGAGQLDLGCGNAASAPRPAALNSSRNAPVAATISSADGEYPFAPGGGVGHPANTTVKDPAPRTAEVSIPEIPPFLGRPVPNTPVNPTDWAALGRRFPEAFAQEPTSRRSPGEGRDGGAPAATGGEPAQAPGRPTEHARADDTVRTCHFTLYGTWLARGFLSIRSRQAKALLANERQQITVRSDEDETFPLYIHDEWEILYNELALPDWFARNLIPAGARLALERESAGVYRIYPLPAPARVIENLRLLEWVDDHLEVHSGVTREVAYEIDEAVYRAEIRLEDPKALAAQAAGGQSIFEILVELLADATVPLPEEWLIETVHGIRQVSASTVPRELRESECFVQVPEQPGHWRFERGLLGEEYAQRTGLRGPVEHNGSLSRRWSEPAPPTWRDIGHPDALPPLDSEWASMLVAMADALETVDDRHQLIQLSRGVRVFGEAVSRFIRAFRRIERVSEELLRQSDAAGRPDEAWSNASRFQWMLSTLRETHGEDVVIQPDYAALLAEMIDAAGEPEVCELFAEEVSGHSLTAWDTVIRPILDGGAERTCEKGAFATTRWLYGLDQRLTGRDRAADLVRVEGEELGTQLLASLDPQLTGNELAEELVQILQLAPGIEAARVKLQVTAREIVRLRSREIAGLLSRSEVDAAWSELKDAGNVDARWAGILEKEYLAAAELEEIARNLLARVFELAGDAETPLSERARIAALALTAVQRFVPEDHRDARLRINMVALLDQVTGHLRGGDQPLLALATELAAWQMLTQIAGAKTVSAGVAVGRYERIERIATRLGVHEVAIVARRKHCERLTELDRRKCYQRYVQMKTQRSIGLEEETLTRMALKDQLLAASPNAETVRLILGDDLVAWLQQDSPANLIA